VDIVGNPFYGYVKLLCMEKIVITHIGIDEVVTVNKTVTEFDPYTKEYFDNRLKGKDSLIIGAHINDHVVGYLVGYNRFNDGSFYCWMVGVNPDFRGKGVLKALMDYQEKWARKREYSKIKIKTRNHLREMLTYLVRYGFYFTEVVEYPNIEDNRILLEKKLGAVHLIQKQ